MPELLLMAWSPDLEEYVKVQCDSDGNIKVDLSEVDLADLGNVSAAAPTDGQVLTFNATSDEWEPATPTTPAHAATHENGGADEISVAGLSGELADPQPPKGHHTSHEPGGSDEVTGVTPGAHHATHEPGGSDEVTGVTPGAHKTTHQNGGADEISVAGLSGLLADDQHVLDAEVLAVAAALVHATRHQNGGADEISVAGLSGELADPQPPKGHESTHVSGGADEIDSPLAAGALPNLTQNKAWKGDASNRPSEVDWPSGGGATASGTYTGDGTEDRAIPHGLGVTPKLVFIVDNAYHGINSILDQVAYIHYVSAANDDWYAVTAMDSTNFYVGDAAAYARSANYSGITYYWVAIG